MQTADEVTADGVWQQATAVLRAGGVVAAPTDTVYGLFCDPRDAAAVERIYAIKGRPAGMELNLLGHAWEAFVPFVEATHKALALAERHWPGGLALVLPALAPRRDLVIPRDGATLMVRAPDHEALRAMLEATGPMASTSANRHGQPAATSTEEVRAQLGTDVDLVIPGRSGGSVASTIIDCTVQPPRVLRHGAIPEAALRPDVA